MVRNFGTFRTLQFEDGKLPEAKLPVDDLVASRTVSQFLRAAYSCDGGISFYPATRSGAQGGTRWLIRTVLLSCAHPELRKDYLKLLMSLEIKAREVPNDGKIKIEDEENIRKFHRLIGFLSGTEVTNQSKYWRGMEKQRVLELLVSSYGRPSKIYDLPRFNRRDDDIVRPS